MDAGTLAAIVSSLSALGAAVAGVVMYALQSARTSRSQADRLLDQLKQNNLSLAQLTDAVEGIAESVRFVQRDLDDLVERPRRRGS